MITSLHVATGAAAGAMTGSRRLALVLGPLLHLACDVIPHEDIASRRFEIASGAALVALVGLRRGWLDAATLGGVAACAPDVEHVVRLPRPGGAKLFPSHRFERMHRAGGISPALQLLAAGAIVGCVLAARRYRR